MTICFGSAMAEIGKVVLKTMRGTRIYGIQMIQEKRSSYRRWASSNRTGDTNEDTIEL
jgi:hypothetical protein